MNKKLEKFSGLIEEKYDCCVNSCMAFTGSYSKLDTCKICAEPRFDNRKVPRSVFRYLPLAPRLQAFFKSDRILDMLTYRTSLTPFDGTLRDVFDSEHFRTLLETTVVVDGVEYDHKFGDSEWDIFVGFTFDGVSLWRGLGSVKSRASTTCWPLAVIVYSFHPKLRTRLENVFSLGVIPGPHSPKHVNSFLFPFYSEARQGAIGIPTFNRRLDRMFEFHWYVIFKTMDMLALVKANGGKSIGAIIPCLKCRIMGVRDPAKTSSTTYYLPHWHPDTDESLTDELLDTLRTHEYFEEAWHELSNAQTPKEFKEIQSTYGITCVPILGLLPSIDIIKSYPFGLMHLLTENLFPNMVNHWKGTFKKLDPSEDEYALAENVWEQIGKETAACTRSTPSWMIRAMPDVWLDGSKYTAESWAFWMTWLAPYLMKDRLPEPHYEHLILLTDIVKLATSLEITEEMMTLLDANVREWHAKYEE